MRIRTGNADAPRPAVEPTASGFDAAALWDACLVWRRALACSGVGAPLVRPRARDEIKPEPLWEFAHQAPTAASGRAV
jgi:hypothetical protein